MAIIVSASRTSHQAACLVNSRPENLSPRDRSALFAAALMHDIAKPLVTHEEGGRVRSPRHASKGARMARVLPWQQYLPSLDLDHFRTREQIVGLVRHHGLKLYRLDASDPARALIAASQVVRLDWLGLLALAHALGRHCTNRSELIHRIKLFREFASENRWPDSPRTFACDHTRFLYLQGRELDPDCEIYDDTRTEVTLMSALPTPSISPMGPRLTESSTV